MAQLRIS